MAYTLLQLVDQVCGEMGLAQPNAVIGSTTQQTVQLLALLQRLGKDLVAEYEWNKLVKAYVFQTTAAITATASVTTGQTAIAVTSPSTVPTVGQVISGTGIPPYTEIIAATTVVGNVYGFTMSMPATSSVASGTYTFAYQDYSLPSDYDRMISDTNWDRTNHWRNLGAKTSQEWQWLQGGVISIGPRERYRIYNGNLRIFAALTSVYNFGFEYVSKNWVLASTDTAASKTTFTADTDTNIFHDNLMMAGLKYYFLKAKKLDYGLEMAEFDDILSKRKAQDQPVPALSLAPTQLPEFVGPWSVQDGNWPTTSS